MSHLTTDFHLAFKASSFKLAVPYCRKCTKLYKLSRTFSSQLYKCLVIPTTYSILVDQYFFDLFLDFTTFGLLFNSIYPILIWSDLASQLSITYILAYFSFLFWTLRIYLIRLISILFQHILNINADVLISIFFQHIFIAEFVDSPAMNWSCDFWQSF